MKRFVVGAAVGGLVAVVACGDPPPPKTVPSSVSDRCPDLTKGDELAAFDFQKEYALSRDAADKLKAAVLAALEIETLSDKLEAELGIACAQIAHDLGNKGDYRSGTDACTAAIATVKDARAKLGPKAQALLVVSPAVCLVETALVTKCASLCDSSVPSEKARAECLRSAGRCDGNCDGTCEPKNPGKCEGMCFGVCDGQVKGTCGGRCVGTCDGKKSNGACLGVCAGTCQTGAIEGECKGQCTGACKLAKAGICDGVCAGTCTVELAEEKCAGDFKPLAVSSDCRARCDLATMNKTECSQPQASYVLVGANQRDADAMKLAIDKAFPALLKILAEVGPHGSQKILTGQRVIDTLRGNFKELAASGTNPKASERQLRKCFDEPFKKAAAAATTAKTGIDQAIGVRDEATKPLDASPPAKPAVDGGAP
ncbi:MAG: hypothetical protein U0270_12340 [Labilithrix sp.]